VLDGSKLGVSDGIDDGIPEESKLGASDGISMG